MRWNICSKVAMVLTHWINSLKVICWWYNACWKQITHKWRRWPPICLSAFLALKKIRPPIIVNMISLFPNFLPCAMQIKEPILVHNDLMDFAGFEVYNIFIHKLKSCKIIILMRKFTMLNSILTLLSYLAILISPMPTFTNMCEAWPITYPW